MDQIVSYQPRLAPRQYQLEALKGLENRRAFALLMAMRTGKTKVLLDDFGRLEMAGDCRDLLVVAPAGVYRTWEGEIQKHLSADLLGRLRLRTWVSGAGQEAARSLQGFLSARTPRIFLVNVEALSLASSGARQACLAFLEGRPAMVVVDESTIIKNPKAKRSRFAIDQLAPRAKYRRILSGLPTPRSPLDLYGQFAFLDAGILGEPTYASFMATYCITTKKFFSPNQRWPAQIVVGYRFVEQLTELIKPHSFRVEFRPDIPSTYSIRDVEMTDEQRRIYVEMKNMATAKLDADSHVTATQVVVQMLRLHQVLCGHTVDENDKPHIIPENKTQQLLELLDDYSGKAVVWVSYDADVRRVVTALEKEYGGGSVARFWGGNYVTREAEEERFKSDPACRFMVATPSAGGRGRTWDAADLVVYYSSLNNLEHRDQSEQRVQGVGKTRQVDYVDLICRGTVEEKILQALRAKIDLAMTITGDNWREWVI